MWFAPTPWRPWSLVGVGAASGFTFSCTRGKNNNKRGYILAPPPWEYDEKRRSTMEENRGRSR